MKKTGIIRRMDGLGRVVIPKEFRRQFKIEENDQLEFYTDDQGFYIRKYNPASDIPWRKIHEVCEVVLGVPSALLDKDKNFNIGWVEYNTCHLDKYQVVPIHMEDMVVAYLVTDKGIDCEKTVKLIENLLEEE